MKQYITIEQFDELSEKGKEKLEDWYGWDSDRDVYTGERFGHLLLSIGQMIEFLDENITGLMIDKESEGKNWIVDIDSQIEMYEEPELCDALWEAVKEILEKGKS